MLLNFKQIQLLQLHDRLLEHNAHSSLHVSYTWLFVEPNNLAYNKPARQSSTSNTDAASNALNGIFTDYSQTETNDDPKWWTVDLQSKYSIGRIKLYEREGDGKCTII